MQIGEPVCTQTEPSPPPDERAQDQPRWIKLEYKYADGTGVPNASYVVQSISGEILSDGQLDGNGFKHVENLPHNELAIVYWFHDDPKKYQVSKKPRVNPEKSKTPGLIDQGLATLAGAGDALSDAAQWSWGVLQGDFNKDPSTSQIIARMALTLIPIVDQIGDGSDLIANTFHLLKFYAGEPDPNDDEFWLWVALVLTAIGCFPELGTAIKGVFKTILKFFRDSAAKVDIKKARQVVIQVLNFVGKGNAHRWLKELKGKLPDYGKWAVDKINFTLSIIESAAKNIPDFAAKSRRKILNALALMRAKTDAMVQRVIDWFKDKLGKILEDPIEKKSGTTNKLHTKTQRAQDPHKISQTNSAYETASNGGKHSGFLKEYEKKPDSQIQDGIKSIEKQIAEHEDKIANPEKHINNFKELDPRQQENLVNKKWPSDIARQKEQADILRGILESRGH